MVWATAIETETRSVDVAKVVDKVQDVLVLVLVKLTMLVAKVRTMAFGLRVSRE